jgi:NADH-quinone oxidoreductase subunit J
MMIETILAWGFAIITLMMALSFVWLRQPIHAALSFACAVISAAGICLLQDAAFVAAALVIVYAGATIIIFLFVLMFAHQARMPEYDLRLANPLLAVGAAIGLIVCLLMLVNQGVVAVKPNLEVATVGAQQENRRAADSVAGTVTTANESTETSDKQSHLAAFGKRFYTKYLLAIEIAGTLLLVATIGSVLIAQPGESDRVMGGESQ